VRGEQKDTKRATNEALDLFSAHSTVQYTKTMLDLDYGTMNSNFLLMLLLVNILFIA